MGFQIKRLVKKISGAVTLAVVLSTLTGCVDWKGKYEICLTEKENLEALFDGSQHALTDCQNEKMALSSQVQSMRIQQASASKPIAAPKRQMGFSGEDVSFDSRRGTITVTLPNATLFDSGSIGLKSAAKSRLKSIAKEIMRKHDGKEISVVGHTDTDPIRKSKWKDNWQLSTERSLAVTRYLLSQGLEAKQMVASGRGQYNPIGQTKSKNRRVEIVVHTY